MNECISWFFDGLGTELISLFIGAIGGGVIGYRVGKQRNKNVQKQYAGERSDQYQEGEQILKDFHHSSEVDNKSVLHQTQKAGDESIQKQVGRQKNV